MGPSAKKCVGWDWLGDGPVGASDSGPPRPQSRMSLQTFHGLAA